MTNAEYVIKLYENIGIPNVFWNLTFKNCLFDDEKKNKIKRISENISGIIVGNNNLIILGGKCTGKTACASLIAKSALRGNWRIKFFNYIDIMNGIISDKYKNEIKNKLNETINSYDLFIFDDIIYNKEYKYGDILIFQNYIRAIENRGNSSVVFITNIGKYDVYFDIINFDKFMCLTLKDKIK